MGKRKKCSGWTVHKRWRPRSEKAIGRPKTRLPTPAASSRTLSDLLPCLWSDDYWPFIQQLIDENPSLVLALQKQMTASSSRYVKRLEGEPLARYLKGQQFKLAGIVQTILTTGHQLKGIHLIKLAKSVVALRTRLKRKGWDADVKAGLLYSKPTTKKYVEQLTEAMPVMPVAEPTVYVVEVCADQYHLWRGCKKGRYHRAVERTGEDGQKVKVESFTVMNLHEYPVDNAKLGMTPEEVEQIREHGPYTEPASLVYEELDYNKALGTLYNFWIEDCELIKKCGEEMGVHPDTCDLDTLLQLGLKLAARPNYTEGPTPMKIHTPRCDSDTNNYDDMQDFWNWLLTKYPDAVAIITHLDGQGVGMLGNAKSIRPERYISCVPKAADMHGEAHFDFAGSEVYFEALSNPMSTALGFKKIEKRPMNLEQDKFDNIKYWNIGAGVSSTVVLVRKFGIEAASDPHRLEELVGCNAGYKILFYYKLQVAGPAMMWQRAQRSNRAQRLNECWAWGFHLWRTAHRTNYQGYVVQRAYSVRCAHPRLQLLLHQSPSMNISGRAGTCQGKDRRMEYFHAECTDWNKDSTHSLEDQLFFTQHFHTLDHVNTIWKETLGLDESSPMETKAGFKTTVGSMVEWMEMRLSLFADKPTYNPFTGLDMEVGDVRVKQPWQFISQVAHGRVGPLGYPYQKKTARQVISHLLRKGMFNPTAHLEVAGLDQDAGDDWGWLDDEVGE